MNTKIILSSIVHKRYGNIQHFFKYKVPSLFIDLDELDGLAVMADTDNSKMKSIAYFQNIYFSAN